MSHRRSFQEKAALGAAAFLLAAGLFGPTSLASPSAPRSGPADTPQALTKKPQHEVSVVLKLIQVYVTDKKGRPVDDLALGDFAATDNGQPVVLTEFERHALADVPAGEGLPGEEAPAPQRPGSSDRRTDPAATRKFFLFFDFAFNNARGLVKAKTAALHFLDTKVSPGDEIGVLTYTMLKGVRVHEYLTRDLAKIREVVEAIGSKDIAGRAADLELQYWTMAQEPLPGAGGTNEDMVKPRTRGGP